MKTCSRIIQFTAMVTGCDGEVTQSNRQMIRRTTKWFRFHLQHSVNVSKMTKFLWSLDENSSTLHSRHEDFEKSPSSPSRDILVGASPTFPNFTHVSQSSHESDGNNLETVLQYWLTHPPALRLHDMRNDKM